jgi:hypothetical protein
LTLTLQAQIFQFKGAYISFSPSPIPGFSVTS